MRFRKTINDYVTGLVCDSMLLCMCFWQIKKGLVINFNGQAGAKGARSEVKTAVKSRRKGF